MELTSKLIARGDSVSIRLGRLIVLGADNLFKSKEWHQRYAAELEREIVCALNIKAFKYIAVSSGKYGIQRVEGITLQFENLIDASSYFTIFNAILTRSRTTKHGKKGTPLPRHQFHLAKGANFVKFWVMTGVPRPPSDTEYYKRMGRVKGILFTGQFASGIDGKLISGSIKPLSINSHEVTELCKKVGDNSVIIR